MFRFHGVNKYLEALVTRIKAPNLVDIDISLIYLKTSLDIRELRQFISRVDDFDPFHRAWAKFEFPSWGNTTVCRVEFQNPDRNKFLGLRIAFSEVGRIWQLSTLAEVCSQFSDTLCSTERLDLLAYFPPHDFLASIDKIQLLRLVQFFPAVKTICISETLSTPTVIELLTGESNASFFPALENVFVRKQ
jgi:hypothetical protein